MTQPFIQSIQLRNFLSFGGESEAVPLRPLNVIIGANGSGKSNFLEAFELLRNTPRELADSIRQGGGAESWLWKGNALLSSSDRRSFSVGEPRRKTLPQCASVEVVVRNTLTQKSPSLRYGFSFTANNHRFEIVDEKVEEAEKNDPKSRQPHFYYKFEDGHPVLNARKGKVRTLQREDIHPEKSILAQRRDSDQYPEFDYLAQSFEKIRLFREWTFGPSAPVRQLQRADMPSGLLLPDSSNLALVLNTFNHDQKAKQRLLDELKNFYDGVTDYWVGTDGGAVQLYFLEKNFVTPASRLSDGTLRYLALLAILCHPELPPLVCIDEPELGLHPDVLPDLADLLKETSERTQLIVTTHSDILVEAFTGQPEDVIVAEKSDSNGTTLSRLDAKQLDVWLEQYSLGQLWQRGHIGGKRW